MKLSFLILGTLLMMLNCFAQPIFPARTNGPNIFFSTNTFWTNTVFRGPAAFSNTITLGSPIDGQNGLTPVRIVSSNSPSTFNITSSATPQVDGTDNVVQMGWNQTPGGASEVGGEASLFLGFERDYLGTLEHYLTFRGSTGLVFRPTFYGIERTNGSVQKIDKLDTWQVFAGTNHTDLAIQLQGTNNLLFKPPTTFANDVYGYDHLGTTRFMFTNATLNYFGNVLLADGATGIDVRGEAPPGTNATTWTFGSIKIRGTSVHSSTNTLTYYGSSVVGDFQILSSTDQKGLDVVTSGNCSPMISLSPNGVSGRGQILSKMPTGNAPIAGLADYTMLLRAKGPVVFAAQDSTSSLMTITNSGVWIPKTLFVNTNLISDGGSRIGGVGITNSTLYANGSGITNASTALFPATNSPSPGDTIRWDGANFYWGP